MRIRFCSVVAQLSWLANGHPQTELAVDGIGRGHYRMAWRSQITTVLGIEHSAEGHAGACLQVMDTFRSAIRMNPLNPSETCRIDLLGSRHFRSPLLDDELERLELC